MSHNTGPYYPNQVSEASWQQPRPTYSGPPPQQGSQFNPHNQNQPYPQQNTTSSFPPQHQSPQFAPQNQGPAYPAQNLRPSYPLQNQYPPQNQGPPRNQFPPQNQGPPQNQFPPQNKGPPLNRLPPQNQGPPQNQFPPQNQGPPQNQFPPQNQGPPQNRLPPQNQGPIYPTQNLGPSYPLQNSQFPPENQGQQFHPQSPMGLPRNHGSSYQPQNQGAPLNQAPLLPPNQGPMYPTQNQGPQVLAQNRGPFASQNQAPQYPHPPQNQGPFFPPQNQGPRFPFQNQRPQFPPQNQVGPVQQQNQSPMCAPQNHGFPPQNQGPICSQNQGPSYPQSQRLVGPPQNQGPRPMLDRGPPISPQNHRPPFAYQSQGPMVVPPENQREFSPQNQRPRFSPQNNAQRFPQDNALPYAPCSQGPATPNDDQECFNGYEDNQSNENDNYYEDGRNQNRNNYKTTAFNRQTTSFVREQQRSALKERFTKKDFNEAHFSKRPRSSSTVSPVKSSNQPSSQKQCSNNILINTVSTSQGSKLEETPVEGKQSLESSKQCSKQGVGTKSIESRCNFETDEKTTRHVKEKCHEKTYQSQYKNAEYRSKHSSESSSATSDLESKTIQKDTLQSFTESTKTDRTGFKSKQDKIKPNQPNPTDVIKVESNDEPFQKLKSSQEIKKEKEFSIIKQDPDLTSKSQKNGVQSKVVQNTSSLPKDARENDVIAPKLNDLNVNKSVLQHVKEEPPDFEGQETLKSQTKEEFGKTTTNSSLTLNHTKSTLNVDYKVQKASIVERETSLRSSKRLNSQHESNSCVTPSKRIKISDKCPMMEVHCSSQGLAGISNVRSKLDISKPGDEAKIKNEQHSPSIMLAVNSNVKSKPEMPKPIRETKIQKEEHSSSGMLAVNSEVKPAPEMPKPLHESRIKNEQHSLSKRLAVNSYVKSKPEMPKPICETQRKKKQHITSEMLAVNSNVKSKPEMPKPIREAQIQKEDHSTSEMLAVNSKVKPAPEMPKPLHESRIKNEQHSPSKRLAVNSNIKFIPEMPKPLHESQRKKEQHTTSKVLAVNSNVKSKPETFKSSVQVLLKVAELDSNVKPKSEVLMTSDKAQCKDKQHIISRVLGVGSNVKPNPEMLLKSIDEAQSVEEHSLSKEVGIKNKLNLKMKDNFKDTSSLEEVKITTKTITSLLQPTGNPEANPKMKIEKSEEEDKLDVTDQLSKFVERICNDKNDKFIDSLLTSESTMKICKQEYFDVIIMKTEQDDSLMKASDTNDKNSTKVVELDKEAIANVMDKDKTLRSTILVQSSINPSNTSVFCPESLGNVNLEQPLSTNVQDSTKDVQLDNEAVTNVMDDDETRRSMILVQSSTNLSDTSIICPERLGNVNLEQPLSTNDQDSTKDVELDNEAIANVMDEDETLSSTTLVQSSSNTSGTSVICPESLENVNLQQSESSLIESTSDVQSQNTDLQVSCPFLNDDSQNSSELSNGFINPLEANLREFDILDEVEGSEEDEGDQSTISSEESLSEGSDQEEREVDVDDIDAMLEEGLPTEKKISENKPQRKLRRKVILEEIGHDHFDLLPEGWIQIIHNSGMPVYLQQRARVCTMSRPYFLGPGSARGHKIPLSAIPCLQYRRALEREKKYEEEHQKKQTTAESEQTNENRPPLMPVVSARIETAEENEAAQSIDASELQEYCKKVFNFKSISIIPFKTWSDRRKYARITKDLKKQQRPLLPSGTKLLKFPIHNADGTLAKSKGEWVINPNGKSYVCILHEYVQHALRQHPKYQFKELKNPATPYSATVYIGEMQYGTGMGASKKHAKLEAAKSALEVLIPEMKDKIESDSEFGARGGIAKKSKNYENSIFDQIRIEDPRVAEFCAKTTEPPPYAILATCLQRNGMSLDEVKVEYNMNTKRHKEDEFKMSVRNHSAVVLCKNKRDGKQKAAQAILKALHPNIEHFGSLLRMYGNHSIKSVKEKKQEEQEITGLQCKAAVNQPNFAILTKLNKEMNNLVSKKKDQLSKGKFHCTNVLPTASTTDLNKINL